MALPPVEPSPSHSRRPATGPGQRLLRLWWRKQSPARQDRFMTLAPLVSVLLFLAAIISAFWYLRNEEVERETESVKRDTEVAQQQIRLRLVDNQELLLRLAREVKAGDPGLDSFEQPATAFLRERSEVRHLSWVTAEGQLRAVAIGPAVLPSGDGLDLTLPVGAAGPVADAFRATRELRQPVYSRSFVDDKGFTVFQLQVPLIDRGQFAGSLIAEYSVEALLRHFVPAEVSRRHAFSAVDERRSVVAGANALQPGQQVRQAPIVYEVPLAPAFNGLLLRGQGWRTSIGLISNTLFWMVVAMSALTVWMLLATWRHMRRRAQIQAALVSETNFRRAMENSMLTGMRAMDLEGRITYVNPAFCAMTGFAEAELIGRLPPYPHWPRERMEENARLLQQELQGRSPPGGIEVKVQRRDGTLFDSRMYVSPLIDGRGRQTGWVTSMTNITEAKRIRDQLTASHERFTTVLEGLEAAVSVLSVQQGELLFANRSYRLWFGGDAKGHGLLAGGEDAPPADGDDPVDGFGGLPTQELTDAGSASREVYVGTLQKWFDVRSRYLQWTDGRLAQMLIATDITARRSAEELAAQQAEKAQMTSRLVTMGEMASSVAHELNQPLTAITNYCNGMVSRVKAAQISQADLIAALEKTARQAERAGQIIHRIRNFVKRREAQRQLAQAHQIVEDAVELVNIELKRRSVTLHTYVAQRLPTLMVDPIMIEQVVLNLLKNGAEAIDSANLPPSRRHIELRVVPRHTAEEGGVIEFSVTDTGPGIAEDVSRRLYEAFFSTKPEGLGIGLGLCRSIVEAHRGRMRSENLYNGSNVVGCRFSFTLPVENLHRTDSSATTPVTVSSPSETATDVTP